jgi:ACDE family multidrug resistance protein
MAETKVYRNRNFQIVCGASLMVMMMAAVITPAFPTIVEALGISGQSIGLLISAFTLPSFLLVLLTGMMADRFGRKKLIVPSLFLFGIFGGACALAPDFKTLLILRGLQGIGTAPLLPVSFAIIGDLFSGQKRAEAMGLNTTVMYIGYVIYPPSAEH